MLDLLEKKDEPGVGDRMRSVDDLPLFSAARPAAAAGRRPSARSKTKLAAISPDELSPREALALIYELKAMLAKTA